MGEGEEKKAESFRTPPKRSNKQRRKEGKSKSFPTPPRISVNMTYWWHKLNNSRQCPSHNSPSRPPQLPHATHSYRSGKQTRSGASAKNITAINHTSAATDDNCFFCFCFFFCLRKKQDEGKKKNEEKNLVASCSCTVLYTPTIEMDECPHRSPGSASQDGKKVRPRPH